MLVLRLGLIAAAMVIGVVLLASCTAAPPSPTTSQTTDTKPYGGLTVSQNVWLERVQPNAGCPTSHYALGAAIFDNVVGLDENGVLVPGLAERWEIAPDGKTHTFFLRKGVKFHNGDDLTAADVKYTIERHMAPEATSCEAGYFRSGIASVQLKDDYTVVLNLKTPSFDLLKGFNDLGNGAAILPKKYIEEKGDDYFMSHPVGSGPWKVAGYETGNRWDLEAVENHWRAVPKFKNLTVLNIKEEATRVAMLRTGELDIGMITPDSVDGLKAAGLRILTQEGAAQYRPRPFWNLDNPQSQPLGDVRVRKAMSLALNRQEMATSIYRGYAKPGAVYYIRPVWDPNVVKPDPFDPDGAKKLLAEAGYPTGFNAIFYDAARAGGLGSSLDLAIVGYWRKVGVNLDIVPIDSSVLSQYRPKGKPWDPRGTNVVESRITSGALAFEKVVTVYHSTRGATLNLRNPKLDALLDKIEVTADPTEKKRLMSEATVMARDEYSNFAALDISTIVAVGSRVGEIPTIKGIEGLGLSFEKISHAR